MKKTDSFYRFKSKAVYAIYLSYVEVAQKALQHDKIQMAMSYLEQASAIQLKYPQQIINDKYVEKELQESVKYKGFGIDVISLGILFHSILFQIFHKHSIFDSLSLILLLQ